MTREMIYRVNFYEEMEDFYTILQCSRLFNSLDDAKEFVTSRAYMKPEEQDYDSFPYCTSELNSTLEELWEVEDPEGPSTIFSVYISEQEIVYETIYEYEIHVSKVDQDIVADDGLGIVVDTYAQAVKEARQKAESLGDVVIQSRNRAEKLCYGKNCCTLFHGDATNSKSSNWAVWILKKKVNEVRKPKFKERKRRKKG